jgi:DNA polymerase III subunit epsilon
VDKAIIRVSCISLLITKKSRLNYSPAVYLGGGEMHISKNKTATYELSGVSIKDIAKQSFLVLDLEATGLSTTNDYITQFACVPFVDGKILPDKAFSSFIKSPKAIPKKIEKLTGISNKDVSKAPQFKEVITKMLHEYNDYIWIAQCGFEFDFPIIESLCKKEGIGFTPKTMDTKVLFAFLDSESDETFSTDFLKDHFQIDSSGLKRHTALGDALLTAKILQKIIGAYKEKGVKDLKIDEAVQIRKFIPKAL